VGENAVIAGLTFCYVRVPTAQLLMSAATAATIFVIAIINHSTFLKT